MPPLHSTHLCAAALLRRLLAPTLRRSRLLGPIGRVAGGLRPLRGARSHQWVIFLDEKGPMACLGCCRHVPRCLQAGLLMGGHAARQLALESSQQNLQGTGSQEAEQEGVCCKSSGSSIIREENEAVAASRTSTGQAARKVGKQLCAAVALDASQPGRRLAGRQPQAPASGQAVRKVSKQAVDCSGYMPCWCCMTAAASALT